MLLRQGGAGKTEVKSSLKRNRKENLFPTLPKSPELKNKNRCAPLSNLVDNEEANDTTLADINNTHYEENNKENTTYICPQYYKL
jgi:hypothetical protein